MPNKLLSQGKKNTEIALNADLECNKYQGVHLSWSNQLKTKKKELTQPIFH